MPAMATYEQKGSLDAGKSRSGSPADEGEGSAAKGKDWLRLGGDRPSSVLPIGHP